MNVTIKFKAPVADEIRAGMSIPPFFAKEGSYVDSPAYVNGVAASENPAYAGYGKSVYATNVPGWGSLPGLKPMANTTARFAWFERAVDAAADAHATADAAGKAAVEALTDPTPEEAAAAYAAAYETAFETANEGVTFEITTADEQLYWLQFGDALAADGFTVTVEATEGAEADSGNGEG